MSQNLIFFCRSGQDYLRFRAVRSLCLICLLMLAPVTAMAERQLLNVVLLISDITNPFYQLTRFAAREAAMDLGIELTVIDLENNPLRPVRVLSSLVNASQKPDAVIFPNLKNTGQAVLELLEQHAIHSIIYDNGFSPRDQTGKPGEKYQYWLGQVLADNYTGSQQLTHRLIRAALHQFPEQRPLPMIVLEGRSASQVNSQRLLGMFDILVRYKNQIQIRQIFPTRFDPEHAYNAVLTAKQRYPEVRIIWAANDAMAISAVKAIREQGLLPGTDLLVTGFDRLPRTTAYIEEGAIYDSAGGHYMSAAWALVYLKDLLKGIAPRYRSLQLPLYTATTTAEHPAIEQVLKHQIKDIDFTTLTLQHRQDSRYIFEKQTHE